MKNKQNTIKIYLLCSQRPLDNGIMVIDDVLGAFSTMEKAYKAKKEKFGKDFDIFVKTVDIVE